MEFIAVIETAAFIWNLQSFHSDSTPYYLLADELTNLIKIFKKEEPTILIRKELHLEMIQNFPSKEIDNIPRHFELTKIVYSFLGQVAENIVEFDGKKDDSLSSVPNIIYDYYTPNVKDEIALLVTHLHSSPDEHIYFTFETLWPKNNNKDLLIESKNKKTFHQTIKYSTKSLEIFFSQYTPIFEHNSKHDRIKGYRFEDGEEIFPLSCFDGKNISIPQKLLDKAIRHKNDKKKLYSFDEVNDTFVCFTPHSKNRYHGYDQPENKVPRSIRDQKPRFID
jgi:hypothetical protein